MSDPLYGWTVGIIIHSRTFRFIIVFIAASTYRHVLSDELKMVPSEFGLVDSPWLIIPTLFHFK